MSKWIKKDAYYFQNGGFTVCKTGIEKERYGLYQGSKNIGWFDSSKDAITKFNEMMKGLKMTTYNMTGLPIIELEPTQTDLEAGLSLSNIQPIELAPIVTDAQALEALNA